MFCICKQILDRNKLLELDMGWVFEIVSFINVSSCFEYRANFAMANLSRLRHTLNRNFYCQLTKSDERQNKIRIHFVHCLRTHSCHTVVEHSSTLDSIWQKIMFGYKNMFFAFYWITFIKPVSRLFVRFLVLGPLVHIICLSVEFNIFGPGQPKHYNQPDHPKYPN